MELLLDNGYQHIDGDGNPDLSLDCVLGGPVEGLDPQVLLDPFEEQLDLPAALVNLGDREGRQGEVVGQKNQPPVLFGVVESDAPQLLGVILLGVEVVKDDDLVALHAL